MRRIIPFLTFFVTLLFTYRSFSQYCTPTITTGGIFISYAGFGPGYSTITNGVNYNSGGSFASEGYANRSGSSSGILNRGCSNNVFFSFQNCGNVGSRPFNFRLYADWNGDYDFDDAGEIIMEISNTLVNGNCAFYNPNQSIYIPANVAVNTVRVRAALCEYGTALACGGFKGEIEDYAFTISANTAPVLNNTGTPVMNPLTETQTSNTGIYIKRLLMSADPVTLITESDPCTSVKGIAITGTSGTGSWEYNTGSSWVAMGAVSESNALLLEEQDRLRFAPSGAGTASLTFRAWDRTAGGKGQYYNITSTGGSSPFSAASESTSMQVYSTASASIDKPMYMPTSSTPGTDYNILTTRVNPSTGLFKQTDWLTTDNINGYGGDIALDEVNGKLYWIGGLNGVDLLRSNTDGTGVETIAGGAFGWPTGVAYGNNKVYLADYGVGLFSADPNGSNLTQIITGDGDWGDVEYYNNKVYYVQRPSTATDYKIYSANTDGTGITELASTVRTPYGFDVVNDNLYWNEFDGANSYMYVKPLSGGSATLLASETSRNWFDLMVSPGNGKIYFSDYNLSSVDPWIKSIPITGGTPVKELLMESTVTALVFNRGDLSTLPVRFITIRGWQQNDQDAIEWKVGEEENVKYYCIERSGDGRNFMEAGRTIAKGDNRYVYHDTKPLAGKSYYRVASVDYDGKRSYSAVVLMNNADTRKSVSVYPSTTTNNRFMLYMQRIEKGAYSLQVIGNTGQVVHKQQIHFSGDALTQSIELPAGLAKGVYRVVLAGNAALYTDAVILH